MPRTSDHRITIRVTPEEYALIEAAAGRKPKSAFLREAALAEAATRRKTAQRVPAETAALLGKILATLMTHPVIAEFKRASGVSESVPESEDDPRDTIRECHAFLNDIRDQLVKALRRTSQLSGGIGAEGAASRSALTRPQPHDEHPTRKREK